jgi:hypothetical protein
MLTKLFLVCLLLAGDGGSAAWRTQAIISGFTSENGEEMAADCRFVVKLKLQRFFI